VITSTVQQHRQDSPTLTVTCPPGSVVLGGGAAKRENPDAGVMVWASYPVINGTTGTALGTQPQDGQVANGWSAIFNTNHPENTVFVVCSP
jgi:hypothetical protein